MPPPLRWSWPGGFSGKVSERTALKAGVVVQVDQEGGDFNHILHGGPRRLDDVRIRAITCRVWAAQSPSPTNCPSAPWAIWPDTNKSSPTRTPGEKAGLAAKPSGTMGIRSAMRTPPVGCFGFGLMVWGLLRGYDTILFHPSVQLNRKTKAHWQYGDSPGTGLHNFRRRQGKNPDLARA